MDKLNAMRVFAEVADSKSFVTTSQKLGLTAPTVTRAIASLEEQLGVKLFTRTTRQVRLTDEGKLYLGDVLRILEDVEQTEASVMGGNIEPKGLLTVTAPVLFGQKYVTPVIADYLKTHSAVSVRAAYYDHIVNILEEGIDVAVRIGHLQDSSLYAVQVGTVRRIVCGSPAYFKQHGIPKHPRDLKNHHIIHSAPVDSSISWRFNGDNGKQNVKLTPRLTCNQNGSSLQAALSGLGITRLMSYQAAQEIKDKRLQTVLDKFETDSLPINIVYPDGPRVSAKVRSFVEFAAEQLKKNPLVQKSSRRKH